MGGFPLAEAAEIEAEEVRGHLESGSRLERIVFAVRGDEAFAAFTGALEAAGLASAVTRPFADAPSAAEPGPGA